MFSPDIVASDAFLEMPISTQALYFHLGMYADDDGFVNPKKIMRMLGASEDDLKVLVARRFALPFENGVIVIKHWKVNNLVRKDWYRPTQYIEEKSTLYVKESGAYTQDSGQGAPLVNEPLTQVRLGKVRIGKEEPATALKSFEEKITQKDPEYRSLVTSIATKDYLSPERMHKIVIEEFLPHWLEKGEGAKKARWQKEKVFDYQKRIRTWIANYHKYAKDYRCRSDKWHRQGETCYCVKEEKREVREPSAEAKVIGASKRITD